MIPIPYFHPFARLIVHRRLIERKSDGLEIMYHEIENEGSSPAIPRNNLPSLSWRRAKESSILTALLLVLKSFGATLGYTENPLVPEPSTTVLVGNKIH